MCQFSFFKILFVHLFREHVSGRRGRGEQESQADSGWNTEPNAGLYLMIPRS